ncbi:unnamed protein product [Calypogeia fissa]
MPGSGLRAVNMVEKEPDLVGPFFDSEDDEVPVDMEMVFEAMKHVPLPDIDYPEQDDSISGDTSLAETLSGRAIRALPDPVVRQGILKRKVAAEETVQPKRKGGGTGRVPKRLKVEFQSNGISTKTAPNHPAKVEIVVGSVTAAAAKVAAKVAPHIVTGGTVAETGPPPDFSLWTVEDDLLLKNAMEAGAAMEALAKGAMRFSRRFTVKELRERWRALLYDPEIAAQAAIRMAEAEYSSNYCTPKTPVEQKNPQELARKRRANSIRTLYYKRRKALPLEDVLAEGANDTAGSNADGARGESNGAAADIIVDSAVRPLPDIVDMDSMSSKDGHSPESEDGTFSQMCSLLAAGGVKAVVAAIPAGTSVNVSEQEERGPIVALPSEGNDLLPMSGPVKLVDSKQDAAVPHTDNGQLSGSGPHLDVPMEEAAGSLVNGGAGTLSEISTVKLRDSCVNGEEGLTIHVTDCKVHASLHPSTNKAERDIALPEGDCNVFGVQAVTPVEQYVAEKGDFEAHVSGICSVSLQVSDGKENASGVNIQLDNRLIVGANKVETIVAEGPLVSVEFSEVKDEQPIEKCSVSAVDHREISNANNNMLDSSPLVKVDNSTLGPNERTELLVRCPSPTMDANDVTDEMEEAETIEALYRECCCGETLAGDTEEDSGGADICNCTTMDETHDQHLPNVLIGESCTGDLDCPYLLDCCIPQESTLGPSILQPSVCALNTEDTEVPSLEGALLASPSYSSASDEGEYVDYADSAYADAGGEGYYYADEVDPNSYNVGEYINLSPRQGVSSARVEPDMMNGFCDISPDPAMLGSTEDKHDGMTAMKLGNNVDWTRGSLHAVDDEKIGSKCAVGVTNPGICIVSTSVSDVGALHSSTPAQVHHQQVVPEESSGGKLLAANNFIVTECQTSTVLPVSGDRETEASPSPDSPILPPETQVENAEAPKLVQDPIEEEVESDEEMARFSDIEAMILDMDLDAADDDFSARAESRRMYRRHGRAVVRSEQAATAAMQRMLNLRGALAILYGRHSKHYITQPKVLMGRATSDNVVDIDLGTEGRANKVSRQQANIKLKEDGVFYLRNLGRRGITVNNISVEKGERAILNSNCLLEVGGMRFIFEINRKLVQEHISRRHQV